ncbi:MAG: AmpG family muropeptide MFS transporter [Desulfobulbaceae bacterium]|nr:AmpG family muropeptide MFS transporter [Desulfobulbaceae bacterium]
MGVASGLPLLITLTLMQAWAKEAGVSLKSIGLMTLVGLPYTLKFVWAPLFDRFTLPFLGRRRGWLLVCQVLLFLAIIVMGLTDPASGPIQVMFFVLAAFLVTFFSASQDIVIDAYRREDLVDRELGLGSSYYIYGYRIGMLVVSGGGLILADHLSWSMVFFIMALCLVPGMITTFIAREPPVTEKAPAGFRESVIDPFADFFRQPGAIWILVFILLYKVGDNMAAALSTPFYLDMGFSKTEIGTVVKLFGFWATLGGAFLGGVIMLKTGINRSLWLFGFLQMISTAGFALLAQVGYNIGLLTGVICFENLSAGMGTAAFVAFMASITNKKFTATQYALLTSFMGVPRVLISSVTGFMAEGLGWFVFFLFCTFIAIPGMLLLVKFAPWSEAAETPKAHV